MLKNDEIGQFERRKLCLNCVGEDFLKDEIRKQGKRGKCSYCGRTAKHYSIEDLSECIDVAFRRHYVRTSDQPTSFQYAMLADRESDYIWERDGEPVVFAIMNAADIPEEAASDIQSILDDKFSDFDASAAGEETEFSSDSYYEEEGPNDILWQDEWREFERSLKTEARFFSRSALHLLASVFDGIDKMRTQDGRPMIVDAGPGTEFSALFRARSFQSGDKLEVALARPDKHLGSPPADDASAGRMNARGISVFYGSNNPTVALAEIRAPVGSQVAVARFEIIRPIHLLDLTALSVVTASGSIFDPTYFDRLERTMFLRNLSRRIAIPVMPNDEAFEYLATQAAADFLASENDPLVDGIIFPSVQATGKALNVVLFHKAARVEEIELPKGTEIHSMLGLMSEDGWEPHYAVIEEIPPKKKTPEKLGPLDSENLADFGIGWVPLDQDGRSSTLRIDLGSVSIHIVDAVEFKTTEHLVHRSRREKYRPDS